LIACVERLTVALDPTTLESPMKPQGVLKHLLIAFLLALAGYILIYQSIEYRRTRKGPWQVTFTRTATGAPAIVINHPKLAITNVQIHFAGETRPRSTNSTTHLFAQPQPVPYDLPFGKCVFLDTTFLPGTVTLQLFGHEIELLPRTLILDRQEHAWQTNSTITLPRATAMPATSEPAR